VGAALVNRRAQCCIPSRDRVLNRLFSGRIVNLNLISILDIRPNRPMRYLARHEDFLPDFFFDQTDIPKSLVQ
jgi:hypothetical protein